MPLKKMQTLVLLLVMATSTFAQSQDEWADRAYVYMAQDSLIQAEECFRRAVEEVPDGPQRAMLLANLGTVQKQRGKVSEAIETYTSALRNAPLDTTILMSRATAYMILGADDKAYTDLCNVLDRNPNHIEALYYRAFIYTHRREYATARADYRHLLALRPDHENGLLGLALLEQREGRLQAAELQLTLLVEHHPDNSTYLQARANVLIERSLYDLALLDLKAAIALQPADAHIYVARAELYLKMKRRSAARADLDRAVALGLPRLALDELYRLCE